MLIKKILYGANRLKDELIGKEDYWHFRLKPYEDLAKVKTEVYYLDMLGKGRYPGEMKEGIPVYYLNGIYPVYFYITILNYGLGLLNRKVCGDNVEDDIKRVLTYIIDEQHEDGGWHYNFPEGAVHTLAGKKISGMTQGLAISFITRCCYCGYINEDICLTVITKAMNMLLSRMCVSEIDGHQFIEEFYVPGNSVLNGSIFALLGLYDYCHFISDYRLFDFYIGELKMLINKFNFRWGWTYYDLQGTVCSRFYQQLHVDLLSILYYLTKDEFFKNLKMRWENVRMPAFFICIKAFQKLMNLNDMKMSYSNKNN